MMYRSDHPDSIKILDTLDRLLDRPFLTNVLITGEPGTGKEGLARALHNAMRPADAPFIKMPTAGRDADVLALHLFGTKDQRGAIDRAQGGTLFLDEVSLLPKETQARLAPVLRGRFRRNDGEGPTACDVCVMGATDYNLHERVVRGEVRNDLYFRLTRIELRIPPLRARPDDIPRAALWAANRIAEQHKRELRFALEGDSDPGDALLTQDAAEFLKSLPWDGNFRALDRVIERAVMLYAERDLTLESIQRSV